MYHLHVVLLTNLMYVTFVRHINVRYISNFTFIWIFYFNMINLKSKIKNVLVIQGITCYYSRREWRFSQVILDGNILEKGMKILSSNSGREHTQNIRNGYEEIDPLPSPSRKYERPQWESNPRPFDPKSNALIHCAMRSDEAWFSNFCIC